MKRFLIVFLSFMFIIIIILLAIWKIFPIKHKALIVKYSEQFDLSPELVSSIIKTESGFDSDAVSEMGAVGLMQILPSTATEIAGKLGINTYDLYNPEDNIKFGCYYLKYLLNYYKGDIVYSLCAYNAGLNNVSYWDFGGDVDKVPISQTKNYVKKVLRNQKIYKLYY